MEQMNVILDYINSYLPSILAMFTTIAAVIINFRTITSTFSKCSHKSDIVELTKDVKRLELQVDALSKENRELKDLLKQNIEATTRVKE